MKALADNTIRIMPALSMKAEDYITKRVYHTRRVQRTKG